MILLSSYIEFKDVKKVYTMGEVGINALDGTDFTIEEGEFVIIAGESGAGKTTILNMLGGMDKVTSGEIRVDEKRIDKLTDKELIT